MLDNFNRLKFKFNYTGQVGLPESYPTPQVDNLLLYVQRNLNHNTVVYTLNLNQDGTLCDSKPIDVFWVNYENGIRHKRLNKIQDQLAYGYNCWKINSNTHKFQIVAYPQKDFYLAQDDTGAFQVFTKLNEQMAVVKNIFVYAEEFGVFPQVKFIELYGYSVEDSFPIYQKILL